MSHHWVVGDCAATAGASVGEVVDTAVVVVDAVVPDVVAVVVLIVLICCNLQICSYPQI